MNGWMTQNVTCFGGQTAPARVVIWKEQKQMARFCLSVDDILLDTYLIRSDPIRSFCVGWTE